MHELHLVHNLIGDIIAKIKETRYKKIVAINIVLGKDSHINGENLKFLVELNSKETVADGAQVNVRLAEGKKVFVESIDVE